MPAVAKRRDRAGDLLRRVGPVHPARARRVERLGAEGHPVDPRRPPGAARSAVDVVGIGLEGDFGARRRCARPAAQSRACRAMPSGPKQGGRAATEIDRFQPGESPQAGMLLPAPPFLAAPLGERGRKARPVAPRSRNRSSCSAGRRRGRGRRGACWKGKTGDGGRKTGDGRREAGTGNGNGERGTGNGERGTRNVEAPHPEQSEGPHYPDPGAKGQPSCSLFTVRPRPSPLPSPFSLLLSPVFRIEEA